MPYYFKTQMAIYFKRIFKNKNELSIMMKKNIYNLNAPNKIAIFFLKCLIINLKLGIYIKKIDPNLHKGVDLK